MLYKVGARVVIKPWLMMEREFGLDGDGDIDGKISFFASSEKQLKGKDRIVDICRVRDGVNGDYFSNQLHFSFGDDHILGYAFAYGEEIEVSKNDKDWYTKTFIHYRPGSCNPYFAANDIDTCARPIGVHGFAFARTITEPEIEVYCKINGKREPLSYLSKETVLKIHKGESK